MSVKPSAPERIEISKEEIGRLLERTKPALPPQDHALLVRIAESYVYVSELLEKKGTTIRLLRSLLFGSGSEKLRDILSEAEEDKTAEASAADSGDSSGDSPAGSESDDRSEQEAEATKEKAKGHGRNGADAYTGAEHEHIAHPSLKPGDPCPEHGCKGKVYQFEPLVLVRVRGEAPLGATVETIEQLRCNLCLKVFPACSPEEFGSEKYDATAASMIAILTYGSGMPFNRLAGLQANLGIPLPASTQWDIVERAAELVAPAFEELIREAAQGDVLHNDDTPAKILEYMEKKERKRDVG